MIEIDESGFYRTSQRSCKRPTTSSLVAVVFNEKNSKQCVFLFFEQGLCQKPLKPMLLPKPINTFVIN